jgi:long-chain fatty acid transport protein
MRKILFSGIALSLIAVVPTGALAGGFASRDQSAVGEGMSFAGEGTPGMGLSAMFWNPAAVTQVKGVNGWAVEGHVSATFPRANLATDPNLVTPALQFDDFCSPALTTVCDNQGNVRDNRIFPAFYGAYRLSPDFFVGLAVNSPFGFKSTLNPAGFTATGLGAGASQSNQQLASRASISTVDVNPTAGWRINDLVSVGAGVQLIWLRNEFSRSLFPLPTAQNGNVLVDLSAKDFGVGFTAGVTFTPSPATEIALGYRSSVHFDHLSGSASFPSSPVLLVAPVTAPFSGLTAGVTGKLTLPDQASLGLRHRITDTWTVLGTVEWTNWSRTQNIPYFFTSGPTPGQTAAMDISFTYRDSWYVAVGAEYRVRPDTTLRAGIGRESSPVTGTLGWIALPDGERTSLSVGLSQKVTRELTFDFAYSYTWINDQLIVVGPGHPDQSKLITLIPGVFNSWGGNYTDQRVQVVSAALRYRFEPPSPLIVKTK